MGSLLRQAVRLWLLVFSGHWKMWCQPSIFSTASPLLFDFQEFAIVDFYGLALGNPILSGFRLN